MPQHANLIGLDCDGYDLRRNKKIMRVDFTAPVADPSQAVIKNPAP